MGENLIQENPARSKQGRGIDAGDKWKDVQTSTFMNWVNLQLQHRDLSISDLGVDFNNGVKLCALIEVLQNKPIRGRIVKEPKNSHQSLQNATVALTAVANDNIRLVNIGSEDIVNGNQKLILGLIWHLILRYQIGKTKFPPKKLMLAWLKAVIPDCNISNFTSDWNDGVALHALLEYCKPGLCPDWKKLSRNNRLDNCSRAMTLAKNEFNIPMIVRPEDFSSPHLDDLSGMTYLSYYMTVDSPGYHATLRNVRALLKHGTINNFTTDWHDGILLCNLTKSLGVEPGGWPNMTSNNVENLQRGMDSARKLGIEPILSAKEMSDPDVEHLGIMAYAAYFTRLTPRRVVADKATINGDFQNIHVGQEKTFQVSVDSDVLPHDVRAEVIGPDSIPPVRMNWSGKTATCSFTPSETGMHKLNVYVEGEAVSGCPVSFQVSSDRSQVYCHQVEKCPIGQTTEMKVDTSRAGKGNVRIEARSPSGHLQSLTVTDRGGVHSGSFNPTEVGDWQMSVRYDDVDVGGSPYTVKVYDPNAVKVYGLEGGAVGKALAFNADTSQAGDGDLDVTVNYQGQNIPCYTTLESNGLHKINFTPQGAGAYKVNVRFAGEEVRGSPYTLEIVDSSMVTVTGDGLSLVPVNRPAVFNVQTRGAGGGNINVDVISPSGRKLSTKIIRETDEYYRIEYFPEEAGDHKITVFFYDQPLRGSPFTCKVYDLGKLIVRNMPKRVLPGNLVLFDIDASLAGSGNIEIRVNEGRVACSVENKGGHQFVASFIPEAPIEHYVEMTFNNTPVEGSPWRLSVLDPQQISAVGHGLELIPINHKAKFKIYSEGTPLDDVIVTVKAPSGQTLPSNISRSSEEIKVDYTPNEVGDYEIRVTCGENEVNGSPFLAKAYDTSAITVTPPADGYVYKPIDFYLDVQYAGEGQLQIMVNNGNLPNEVEVQEDGVYKITFVPVETGKQTIDISFNEEHLPCSPLTCNASDLSSAIVSMKPTEIVNQQAVFDIKTETDNANQVYCTVEVYSPTGQKVPVHITGNASTGFRVEYVPRDIGTHVVTASLAGIQIKGSPFRVKSFDPTQVKVSQMPQGIVGTPCKFIVDASSAGEGTLELTVSANGRNIPNQARALGGGRYEVSFVGRQATKHQANITYNGLPVPGCPFEIDFLDASKITAHGDGLSLVSCHRPAHFSVHAPGAAMPDLSVRVQAPDGREHLAKIRQKNNDTFDVEWTPHEIGDHRVIVEYADMPISGSPYTVKAFDASNVKVSHIGQAFLGRPVPFTLDASEAGDGNLEIQVTADHDSVPNYVRQDGDMSFKVSFTPQKAKTHLVNIRFNGEPVPGSPFHCRILDSDRVQVSSDSVKQIPAGVLAGFKVDPQDAGEGELDVKVISPTGHEIPSRITGSSLATYKVDYTPQEIGRYKVYVEYGGVEVNGSPFTSNVYDPSLVKVEYPNRAYLGRPIYFHVDASAAGQGELAAEIKSHGSTVASQFREVGVGRYELSFTPQDMSTHVVTALFNNYPIPGSPFHVDVIDTSSVTMSGQGLRTAQVYRETWFNLDLHGMDDTDLDVQIVSPSGHELPCKLSRKGHICRAEFTPMEVGSHFIDVFFAGNKLHGSPFISHAFDPSLVRITDVDRTGKREREIGFTVDATMAGVGELDAVVSHNGHRVQTYRESIDEGRYRYTFIPGESGHYEVNAKFNDEAIPGCPVVINVEEEIPTFITISFRSVEALNVNEKNHHFMLHMNGKQIDMSLLQIQIQAPNGDQVPARLAPQPNGDFKVEWTPNVAGRHTVDVSFAGQQIQGSPFYIEVFDITKVRVDNFFNGNVHEPAGFTVDGSRAGKAEQHIQITSPSGRSVPFDIQENRTGEHKVTYRPNEGGKHRLQIAYGGLDVNGSPFTQEIGEGALPSAHGDGLYRGEEDKTAGFTIDSRGFNGEPTVQVDGPNSMAKVSLERQHDGNYYVSYMPVEVGTYDVFIKWNGRDIHGSPFHPKIVDARKVRVVGGWQHYMDPQERVQLTVGEEKRIPFDTSDAGPGQLTAEVKGPSGHVHATIDDAAIGRSVVCFTPREEGNHYIHLYWSEHPLSNSPFLGYATGGSLDPSKVILTGRGLKEAIIREEAEFLIDGSQAGLGNPEVQLIGVRAEVNVIVTPLGGGKFRCTYIPVIPGGYLLHISWNNRQLKGSPYKVNITGAFYPNRVEVSGEGLKGGMMGDDIDVRIDTRKAGPGELTAYCMGPTNVAFCELQDNHDGRYNLRIKPQETGRHVLQIKYGGEHVLGSPYAFRISAQPDASKVRVSGPGVEHGILATFQSRFIVETRGAGQGQLTVRIRGPKGAFQVEMYRDSQKDRTILCRYDPAETGLYVISIRWSGVDVPGSPFHVHIVDTQHDLEHVLQEAAYSTNSMLSRHSGNYSQWRDDI